MYIKYLNNNHKALTMAFGFVQTKEVGSMYWIDSNCRPSSTLYPQIQN